MDCISYCPYIIGVMDCIFIVLALPLSCTVYCIVLALCMSKLQAGDVHPPQANYHRPKKNAETMHIQFKIYGISVYTLSPVLGGSKRSGGPRPGSGNCRTRAHSRMA